MPLSDKLRRLASLLEPDIDKMINRQNQKLGRHLVPQYDGAIQVATFWDDGVLVAQGHAELVGRMNPQFGMFMWWFHKRAAQRTRSRLDQAREEASSYEIPELTGETVGGLNEAEGMLLVNVMAQVARAEGVVRIEDEYGVSFVALFEGCLDVRAQPKSKVPAAESTAPKPRVTYAVPTPMGTPRMNVATSRVRTITGAEAPKVNTPVREPSREIVSPLVQAALALAVAQMPGGFAQMMLMVVVEMKDGKARYFVQLVASDGNGDLHSLDTTRELQDAAAQMITDDVRSGNGRWGKMVVRLRRTQRGASVEVHVKH